MKLKLFILTVFAAIQAQAVSPQYVSYLNYETNWSAYQAFKSLSPNTNVPTQTFHGQWMQEQYALIQNLRSKEFSAANIAASPATRLMQFKAQTRVSGSRANQMLSDQFWSDENYQRVADVVISHQQGKTILTYDLSIAEVSCELRQKIVNPGHPDWNDYQALALTVAPDSMQKKSLKKIIVQACTNFSHLLTQNIQVNYLFQDTTPNTVYLVGYNQAFVKQTSIDKIKIAFLFKGVETGIADEIFERFIKLETNLRNMLK